jgi:small subunit ribosomal protein S9
MKSIHASGKRKTAIARATLKEGKGIVKVNGVNLDNYEPAMARLRIQEPLILVGDLAKNIDVSIKIEGGGISSQADAARLAVGRTLAIYNGDLKETLEQYDRQLLVADVRRKETHKPNCHGKARAKRQKSYR